jgi:transcriptional regulator with XRE-family HTH domain
MTDAALFGKRLRDIRKAHKLRLGQLAERADTGVKHLGRIERGEKQPSFELIFALAKAMKVSPAAFFELEPGQSDPKVLKSELGRLLEGMDTKDLQKVHRVLKALFQS